MTGRLHGCCCSKVGLICSDIAFNSRLSLNAISSSPFDRFSTIYDESEVIRVYDEETLKSCEIVFFGFINMGASQLGQGFGASNTSSIQLQEFATNNVSSGVCHDYITNGGKVICISERTSAAPVVDTAVNLATVQGNATLSTNLNYLKTGVEFFGARQYYAKKDVFQTFNLPPTQVVQRQTLGSERATSTVSTGSLPWDTANGYIVYPFGYGDAFRNSSDISNPVVKIGNMTSWQNEPTAQMAATGFCGSSPFNCTDPTNYSIGTENTGPFSYQQRGKGFVIILSDLHMFGAGGKASLGWASTLFPEGESESAYFMQNQPFLKSLLNPCANCL